MATTPPEWWRNSFTLRACLGSLPTLFSLSRGLCHTFKKYGRALYGDRFTGEKNFPSPGLCKSASSLHDIRKIGWVAF
jgi:hypothetical protein